MIFSTKKQAQVTIFVIIAVLLLFSSATFLFIKDRVEESAAKEAISQTEAVAKDFEKIQEFTVSCLHNVLKEGILRAGMNGGYPAPEDMEITPNTIEFSEFQPKKSDLSWFYSSVLNLPH